MPTRLRAAVLDYAPALALLGMWAVAGLGGALVIAQADGDLRHLALGVVTLPSLVLIGLALRRERRAQSGRLPVAARVERSRV